MNIEIRDLSKQYIGAKSKALDHINLTIKPGIFGLIGENGAGKTTLLNILATKLKQSSGEVHIDQYKLPQDETIFREHLGYLPQNFDFFDRLSVYEAMDYISDLKGMPNDKRKENILQLLEAVHLSDKTKVRMKQLSGGMKQRLGIAQSLLGNSDVIIMDEPTVGLDPTERLNFRNLLSRYAKNKTIILSSHIISDISSICNTMAIMKMGKILYSGSTQKFIQNMNHKVFTMEVKTEEDIPEELQDSIISIVQKEGMVEVRYFIEETTNVSQGVHSAPTLEDAYFYVVKKFGGTHENIN